MARTLSEYRITRELGEAITKRLVTGCIRDLQAMKENLFSGEDSGLENIWDEICVQQQQEQSIYWDVYQITMDTFIEHRVDQLLPHELDAMWLLTQEGDDWDTELEEERDAYPVMAQDVVVYLQDELLTAASNWSNARISNYINSGYE